MALDYSNDNSKEEIINGVIYNMSPLADVRHSMVINRLNGRISIHLLNSTCDVHADNVYLYVDENNRVIPDLMIVCDRSKYKNNGYHGVPKFIVEVLSSRYIKNDRVEKMALYSKIGVQEYWIVDYKAKRIEVYDLKDGSYVLDETYTLELDKEAEDYNEEISVKLKTFPLIEIKLKEIFDFEWNR
ncbi:MAG: Uma2 family endonuclease [Niameybacter sp.]|uniref:Uma2 family endonuclease n=1 Tax=Niameybacter sp. TaxID=2033640 RepID=UPI002FCBA6D7